MQNTIDEFHRCILRQDSDPLSCVKNLLEKGHDVNATWDTGQPLEGWTLLHLVAAHKNLALKETAELVIKEYGADLNKKNKDGDTPLHKAARERNTVVICVLIEAGADLNIKNNNGHTPRKCAWEAGYIEIAKALYDAGGEV